jgi:hypothetical protein
MTSLKEQDAFNPEFFQEIASIAARYLSDLDNRSTVTAHTLPGYELPSAGLGASGALELFKTQLEPLMIASSGPRYWGFVTGGSTPASIAGRLAGCSL